MREERCGVWVRHEGEEVRDEGGKVSDEEGEVSEQCVWEKCLTSVLRIRNDLFRSQIRIKL